MKHSLLKRGAVVFLATFASGTVLAFAFQYAEANAIEREHPHPPEPTEDAGPPPKVPCSSSVKGQPVTGEMAADCAWREQRDRALESCYRNGGIPALGFGFTVVCIEGCVREYDPAKPGETRDADGYGPECH